MRVPATVTFGISWREEEEEEGCDDVDETARAATERSRMARVGDARVRKMRGDASDVLTLTTLNAATARDIAQRAAEWFHEASSVREETYHGKSWPLRQVSFLFRPSHLFTRSFYPPRRLQLMVQSSEFRGSDY